MSPEQWVHGMGVTHRNALHVGVTHLALICQGPVSFLSPRVSHIGRPQNSGYMRWGWLTRDALPTCGGNSPGTEFLDFLLTRNVSTEWWQQEFALGQRITELLKVLALYDVLIQLTFGPGRHRKTTLNIMYSWYITFPTVQINIS